MTMALASNWTHVVFVGVMASPMVRVTVKATLKMPSEFVEVIALPTPTETAFVIAMNWQVAQTVQRATTMQTQRKTTVHVTSAPAQENQPAVLPVGIR